MLITVVVFIATLLLLVVVHEFGHFFVARWFGVAVSRVSLGFGPVIWRLPISGPTEYVVSAIPLGGYIKLRGETHAEVADANAMCARPLWQRSAIVGAGPAANLLLAVLLYAIQSWVGTIEPAAVLSTPPASSLAARAGLHARDQVTKFSEDGAQWNAVSSLLDLHWAATAAVLRSEPLFLRVVPAGGAAEKTVRLPIDELKSKDVGSAMLMQVGIAAPFGEGLPLIQSVVPGAGADIAGVRAGDLVLSIDGQDLVDADKLLALIQLAGRDGRSPVQTWRVQRAEGVLELQVRAAVSVSNGVPVARVGVVIAGRPALATLRFGFVDGLHRAIARTYDNVELTFRLIGRMIAGQASSRNVAGPITSAQTAGQAASLGLVGFLTFAAMLSVGMGALNLLPLPLLDGGHLAQYLVEGVLRRPLSSQAVQVLQRSGAILIVLITALALYNDALRVAGSA